MQSNDPMTERKSEFDEQTRIDAERAISPAQARPDPAPAARAATEDYLQRSRDMAGDGNGEPTK